MPSTFDQLAHSRTPQSGAGRPDRALHNAASFVAFVLSPLQMALLSRTLGAAGFGRWWWTFMCLEAASLLGMQCADLYVRRELPRHAEAGDVVAMHRVVGAALATAGGAGLLIALLQLASADAAARAQADPPLAAYLATLAALPLLTNLGAVLAAALQSVDAYRAIALVRGVVGPLILCAFLAVAWLRALAPDRVLLGIVAAHGLTALASIAVYARRFDLRATLAHVALPREAPRVLASGLALLPPNVLWLVGGKIDLFMLRSTATPETLGVYAACLQLAAVLPYTRTIFDPVAQAQIGASAAGERSTLGSSLPRLSRLCALALSPFFVGLLAVGEPALSFLLGRPAAGVALPLTILSVGQLLGSMALASWLAPMLLPGRVLSAVAVVTLLWKVLVLWALAPRLGMIGAALATATGTVVAQHGAAALSGRLLRVRIYTRPLVRSVAGVLALGAAAALSLRAVPASLDARVVLALGAPTVALVSLAALFAQLEPSERHWVGTLLRVRPRRE